MATEVAKHHGLHIDRRAPGLGNVVQLAVDAGTVVVPALEHRDDGAPQLLPRVGREVAADAGTDQRLEARDQFLQIVGVERGVELHAALLLDHVDDDLERVMVLLGHGLQAHHHVAVHLHKTAVGIPGKARVAGLARQSEYGLVVQAQVQDRVHHAGHGGARAGAHRQQQRVLRIAKAPAHLCLHRLHAGQHLVTDQRQHRVAPLLGEGRAGFGADGEAGRHRNAQTAHFGQVGALAAEQVLHLGCAFGAAAAKQVNVFLVACHGRHLRKSCAWLSDKLGAKAPGVD